MNAKQKKEVDERLFEKLKEFIVCKMVDVDTTHDAPHFCDGTNDCLKECYKWKCILEEIHSEIERAEKELRDKIESLEYQLASIKNGSSE